MEADRIAAPLAEKRINAKWLVKKAKLNSINELWDSLLARPFPFIARESDMSQFSLNFPEATAKILDAAARAVKREVDLLGTGSVQLGTPINWLADIRTHDRWEPAFCRSIDYVNRGRPSDVKIPWELSRLQWLMPAAQAYRLTGDEEYAAAVRDVIDEWITHNPYAWTVNWSCTMEPALRILTWTWFFHQLGHSRSWQNVEFRGRFLSAIYLHGRFVDRHIERSHTNGNHLTADAAGLVFAGLFFGNLGDASSWANAGWNELEEEIEKQVHPDGVDFEASVPYHRLVTELFLLPARYRQTQNLSVSSKYAERLKAMVRFVAAYSRPDGTSPSWGDADDGRAIPLGTTSLSDHRYLIALVGLAFNEKSLTAIASGPRDEVFWHFGEAAIKDHAENCTLPMSTTAFPAAGVYILSDTNNHVFIDCGPVGLAGLGGHGHNDALSFEAWLNSELVITDPGAYCYTASFDDRNAFRSTSSHNTVQVDGQEANRFYSPDHLWNLHDDARCECLKFEASNDVDTFIGRHHGYQRLTDPVSIKRSLRLDHATSTLTIQDNIEGGDFHELRLPLHLAVGATVSAIERNHAIIHTRTKNFIVYWDGDNQWSWNVAPARISPSYGISLPSQQLVWTRKGKLPSALTITVAPHDTTTSNLKKNTQHPK